MPMLLRIEDVFDLSAGLAAAPLLAIPEDWSDTRIIAAKIRSQGGDVHEVDIALSAIHLRCSTGAGEWKLQVYIQRGHKSAFAKGNEIHVPREAFEEIMYGT